MKTNNKGFTLVELILVISIIAILMVITSPNLNTFAKKVKGEVCNINCSELDKVYNLYLITESVEHSDKIFENYLIKHGKNICPADGTISFRNGKVKCGIHSKEEESDDGGDDVPYL